MLNTRQLCDFATEEITNMCILTIGKILPFNDETLLVTIDNSSHLSVILGLHCTSQYYHIQSLNYTL